MVVAMSTSHDRRLSLSLVATALVVALGTTSAGQSAKRAADREAVAGAPAGAWARDVTPPGWFVIETRSYQLQSRLSRETTVELGRHLEDLLELYRALVPSPPRTERMVVKLLADEDEYQAYGDSTSRFGDYDPSAGEVVVWSTRLVLGRSELAIGLRLDPDRVHTLTFAENQAVLHLLDAATLDCTPDLGATLAHWCWVQYLDLRVWPKGAPTLPPWLEQGLAEHFASAVPDARGKYRTGPNADRIKDLGWLLVQGDARPLAQLLAPQGDELPFEVGPGPPAQGWSLVYFLLTSDDPARRELVPRLLAEAARSGDYQRSAAAVFGDLDLERLQADWLGWAGSLRAGDPLAELAQRFGDKVRPDQLTGDVDLVRRYSYLWNRRKMPQPGQTP